jgi:predicted ATPase
MLRSLAVSNFKPFGTIQTADLAPLTLIYGPNSGGKSSIIQSLLLLKQSFAGGFYSDYPLMPRGDSVDLGGFKSLLHKHDLGRTLNIELSFLPFAGKKKAGLRTLFDRRGPMLPNNSRKVRLFYSARSAEIGKIENPQLSRLGYDLEGDEGKPQLFSVDLIPVVGQDEPVQELVRSPYPYSEDATAFEWMNEDSIASYCLFLFKSGEIRDQFDLRNFVRARRFISGGTTAKSKLTLNNLMEALSGYFLIGRSTLPYILFPKSQAERANPLPASGEPLLFPAPGIDVFHRDLLAILRSVEYLGPMRSAPERHYFLGNAHSEHVGKHGENTPQMLYYRSKEITGTLNKWFEYFEIPYTVSLGSFGDEVVGEMIVVNLNDLRNQTKVTQSDVGFGIGQLLPVLVQGIFATSRILCVEQPEIHLHPRLQGALGDFFLSSCGVLNGSERWMARKESNQWLVETHSESLILRVLKRIREGKVKPSEVSVLYVNPIQGVGSEILRLRIDDKGKFIDEWPQGCFEESFQEMFF